MSHNAEAYQQQLDALLPPGRLWDSLRDDPLMQGLLLGLGDEFARVEAGADELLEECDPRTTIQLLPDWETFAGLPDKCAGSATTFQERHDALQQRITSQGALDFGFYQSVAQRLGYQVTLKDFKPFRCGVSHVSTDALNPVESRFHWDVDVPGPRITHFRCGESQVGTDPLTKISRATDLECMFKRLKATGSVLTFTYSGA